MLDILIFIVISCCFSFLCFCLYKEQKKSSELYNLRQELEIEYLQRKLEIDKNFWEED